MNAHTHMPASLAQASAALKPLFSGFPIQVSAKPEEVAGTYLRSVEGYSQAAIEKAVDRLIRGEVEGVSPAFMPSPAQVSQACRYCEDLLAPPTPRRALPPPEEERETEEHRQRVADAVRQWVKDRTPETSSGWIPRAPGDIVRELHQITLSDHVRRQFNLPPAGEP